MITCACGQIVINNEIMLDNLFSFRHGEAFSHKSFMSITSIPPLNPKSSINDSNSNIK